MKCSTGHYVPVTHKCLYEFDMYGYHLGCRDVTHLRNCESFVCPKDYVKCPNAYCIPTTYVCDGKWDCVGGVDEEKCENYTCPGQYKCFNKTSCVPLHKLCDGIKNCQEGDDELLCEQRFPTYVSIRFRPEQGFQPMCRARNSSQESKSVELRVVTSFFFINNIFLWGLRLVVVSEVVYFSHWPMQRCFGLEQRFPTYGRGSSWRSIRGFGTLVKSQVGGASRIVTSFIYKQYPLLRLVV
ncbi:hypothetical protein AVEN_249512-1 [Araneus ventricosus]|uniref:Uncharacterized protein n=1 Tax=Araneus ventricosus TaxID=182803 RepID=A0A4Y2HMU8_ARAVE|nr:hypothetical protein AVEN_249512-1 [Araneus ventricosus]